MVTLDQLQERTHVPLLQWQREFIEAKERSLILCCGRKSGKTEAICHKLALVMLNENFSHTDGICVISGDAKAGKEILLKIRSYLSLLGHKFHNDFSTAIKLNEHYATMTQLMFNIGNGKWNRLQSFAVGYDGTSIRPYSFYILVRDEDAFISDNVDPAASACLAVHGVQEIRASTPQGDSGSFYQAWHSRDWRKWHIKTSEVPHVTKEFLTRERQRLGKDIFQQEYEALFLTGREGVFPKEFLAAAQSEGLNVNWDEIRKRCILYMGIDYARFGEDMNAIALDWYDPASRKHYIEVEIMHSKMRTTTVNGRAIDLFRKANRRGKIGTDDSGIGAGATDALMLVLGRRVVGLSNQKRNKDEEGRRPHYQKVDFYIKFYQLFENAKVVLDPMDNGTINSLRSMKYTYTEQNDLTIKGYNNHAAEAIVRAAFLASKRTYGSVWVDAVPHLSSSHSEDNIFA